MDLEKLADLLRKQIQSSGIPIAEVARRAGIGRSTLHLVLRGANPRTGKPTRLSRDRLERLAAVLALDEDARIALLKLAAYPALEQVPRRNRGFLFGAGFPVVPETRSDMLRDILKRTREITEIVEELLKQEEKAN